MNRIRSSAWPVLFAIGSMLALNVCTLQRGAVPQSLSAYAVQRHSEGTAQPHKIYVANANSNSITTYAPDGSQTKPTITAAIDIPFGIAVDAGGKIYVANAGNNTITTYAADGRQTSPTIAVHESNRDFGVQDVAVDANGTIYVLDGSDGQGGDVKTYNADGSPGTLNFVATTSNWPEFLAVDANGKIYVSVYFIDNNGPGAVYSFSPAGKRTVPTLHPLWPWGIAIGPGGNIYVASGPGVAAYTPDGQPTQPRINDRDRFGNGLAYGITVDSRGYVYAANCASSPCGTVTTYNAAGKRTMPTITKGLAHPVDVAVH